MRLADLPLAQPVRSQRVEPLKWKKRRPAVRLVASAPIFTVRS
jgi:hypothetical protein